MRRDREQRRLASCITTQCKPCVCVCVVRSKVPSSILGTAARATFLLPAHRCYGHNLTSTFSVWCMTSGSSLDRTNSPEKYAHTHARAQRINSIPIRSLQSFLNQGIFRFKDQCIPTSLQWIVTLWIGVATMPLYRSPPFVVVYDSRPPSLLLFVFFSRRSELLQKVEVAPQGRLKVHVVPVIDPDGFAGLADTMKPKGRQVQELSRLYPHRDWVRVSRQGEFLAPALASGRSATVSKEIDRDPVDPGIRLLAAR
mmetsp:Transcript_27473/g.60700  ORF Transcript_27473/g.60700 Transcript_27473/m.60700 type:complete len:255 (-) Transcript_27473:185-949(-)